MLRLPLAGYLQSLNANPWVEHIASEPEWDMKNSRGGDKYFGDFLNGSCVFVRDDSDGDHDNDDGGWGDDGGNGASARGSAGAGSGRVSGR